MEADDVRGSRAQFKIRLQRLMDMTLEDLARAGGAKDAEFREVESIRSVAVKLARLWNEVSKNTPSDSRTVGKPGQSIKSSEKEDGKNS